MEAQTTFSALKDILLPYQPSFSTRTDTEETFYLEAKEHGTDHPDPMFFASVQVKKRYVSFHLMPVYVNPALLDPVSEPLRKRMQGKSCFNFTKVDETLFSELAELTERGFADYRERGLTEAKA